MIHTGFGTPYATASDKVSICHLSSQAGSFVEKFIVPTDGVLTGFMLNANSDIGSVNINVGIGGKVGFTILHRSQRRSRMKVLIFPI